MRGRHRYFPKKINYIWQFISDTCLYGIFGTLYTSLIKYWNALPAMVTSLCGHFLPIVRIYLILSASVTHENMAGNWACLIQRFRVLPESSEIWCGVTNE